jgi:predicted small lipoprotein YifL
MMSRANISRMKMRALYIVSLTILLCGLGLTACGSTGALYLPQKPSAPQRTAN